MRDFLKQIEKPKPRTVAAFLFLPQFHRSFNAFSHIKPTFMQIIATVLEQAGLLHYNHPALRYGEAGVPHVSLTATIQEAWFNLRNLPAATPYQYSIFGVVVSVIAMAFILPIAFFVNVLFGVSAQAQMFTNPIQPSSPAPAGPVGPNSLVETGITHPDYAIDILNKVIKSAADNVEAGPALQKGLIPLLGTFNMAVLVIAAFVVFWAILSIVVDTARTGQIGGQRHNMTWAPIRFVWGLALIIPLGGGLSSGQYIMLKISEWGSNLGSRGWEAYVAEAAGKYVSPATPPMPQIDFWYTYTKAYVCGGAYNYYYDKSVVNPDTGPNHITASSFVPTDATQTQTFTNKARGNMCGQFQMVAPSALPAPKISNDLSMAIYKYQIAAANAEVDGFNAANNLAKGTAAAFLQGYIKDFTPSGFSGGGSGCSATYPQLPAVSCIMNITKTDYETYIDAFDAAFTNNEAKINEEIVKQAVRKGWLGMGTFLQLIASANYQVQNPLRNTKQARTGDIMGLTSDQMLMSDPGAVLSTNYLTIPSHERQTTDAMIRFDGWWRESLGQAPAPALSKTVIAAVVSTRTKLISDVSSAVKYLWQKDSRERYQDLKSAVSGSIKIAQDMNFDAAIQKIFNMKANDQLMVSLGHQATTYPLTEMVYLGNNMIKIATAITGSLFVLGLIPVLSGGVMAISGFLGNIIGFMWLAGFVIVFLLPLIPFIRVMFAGVAWIASVFEAIVMVPLLGLACLNTEGEGMGAGGKQCWSLALNILFRPILVVIGFVGALLVFSAFVSYLNQSFNEMISLSMTSMAGGWFYWPVYSVIYMVMAYILVNSCFKLVDTIPDAASKYLGIQRDTSFSDNGLDGAIMAGARIAQTAGTGAAGGAAKLGGAGASAMTGGRAMAAAKDKLATDKAFEKLTKPKG